MVCKVFIDDLTAEAALQNYNFVCNLKHERPIIIQKANRRRILKTNHNSVQSGDYIHTITHDKNLQDNGFIINRIKMCLVFLIYIFLIKV